MEVSVSIRDFRPEDARAIVEIQRTALQSAQWQTADYEHLSRQNGGMVLVAEPYDTHVPIGFLAARVIGEEAELYNLAVAGQHRRRGVAKGLVQEFHRRLAAEGVLQVTGEARASNAPALSLYRSFGYVECGVRRNYYPNDGEDAVLLQCDLGA